MNVIDCFQNASASTAPAPSSMYSNITCNSVPMIREAVTRPIESEYVYDLYYTNSQQLDFRQLQDFLTIQAFGDELVFADNRADEEEFVEVYDDEDDSNDEGNWRNDYPEEDPHFIENHEQEYSYGDGRNLVMFPPPCRPPSCSPPADPQVVSPLQTPKMFSLSLSPSQNKLKLNKNG